MSRPFRHPRRLAVWFAAASIAAAAGPAQSAPPADPKAAAKSDSKPEAKADPKDSPARNSDEAMQKAREALSSGKVDDAFALLQEAVRKNPALPPARLILARMFLGAGAEQSRNGRMLLEQAAAESPEHPEVYLTLASVAASEGRVTEALLGCKAALELSASDRWSAEQRRKFRREARLGMATVGEARGDWPLVRTNLATLLDEEPKNGLARRRLGIALFWLNRPDEAYVELQAGTGEDRTLEPAAVTMAQLWTRKGEAKKAREWLEKAVAQNPNVGQIHYLFAAWLLEQGLPEQARIHALTAVKLDPGMKEADGLLAMVARQLGDNATAETILQRMLKDNPSDFTLSDQLALVLIESDQPAKRDRALQLAEVNIRQFPRNAPAAATYGWVCFKLGRLDDAEKALGAAVSGRQSTSDILYYFASVLSQRGRLADARKLLQTALNSPGVFVHRKAAQAWMDKLGPEK